MTVEVQKRMCTKFCVKLECSSTETIGMIQKAPAMGNFIMTTHLLMHQILCRVFWQTIKSPRWLSPLTPHIWGPAASTFSLTKTTFEREKISDHGWNSGKYDGEADGDWENCVRSQGGYFEGDWGITVLCTMFLVSCILFNICLYFSYYVTGYLLDGPCTYTLLKDSLLVNSHTHSSITTSHIHLCVWERTFKFCSLNKLPSHNCVINYIHHIVDWDLGPYQSLPISPTFQPQETIFIHFLLPIYMNLSFSLFKFHIKMMMCSICHSLSDLFHLA